MASSVVHGWYIDFGKGNVPMLQEGDLKRSPVGRGVVYTTAKDAWGNTITMGTYIEGDTFFESKLLALYGLVRHLRAERSKHMSMAAFLQQQIDQAEEVVELEEKGLR
jgi:hypothetical protein